MSPLPQENVFAHVTTTQAVRRRGSVAWRLLGWILLFSSVITLLATALQLYLDYQRDISAIDQRLTEIERSAADSIAGSLWNLDAAQLNLQLNGLMRLPDMQYVQVIEQTADSANPMRVTAGRSGPGGVLRDIPLVHLEKVIGTLHLEASLDRVYRTLWNTALVILVSQGIKTFLVSLFTLYIVYALITRHLVDIGHFLASVQLRGENQRLHLARTQPPAKDELDQVVDAVNAMTIGLKEAYDQISWTNAQLETDIHQRRQREAELQRAMDNLTSVNTELERFAYVASHDLQEPLRAITAFTQLLARRYHDHLDDEGRQHVAYVVDAAKRMHALINDLLAYSKVGGKARSMAPVSAQVACDAAIQQLYDSITEQGASVLVSPLPDVIADEVQLVQVFLNLLGNAIKFRKPGEPPRIKVWASLEPNGVTWRFSVQDNGIGIDPDLALTVFELFRRLDKSQPGTGVGLAICKRIIERHHGRIWLESQAGQGCTVHFTLPHV